MTSNRRELIDTFVDLAAINTSSKGAPGIILSRKYSEMKLANFRAAGRAIREALTRS